ncbi:MAG: RNA methyltransferase [Acidobacteria bacterium]|nr:RNA methyltransferase [Acidobacteriota bacterium]
MIAIAALDDPRVEAYRQVGDHDALEAEGLFVAEGRLVVARLLALSAGAGRWAGTARSVLLSPAAFESMSGGLELSLGVPVYVAPQDVMNGIVGFNIHRGCLALARRLPVPTLSDELLRGRSCAVVLEGVSNPDNIGGIFRSGAALGADLVALGPGCADPLYRKSIRTSIGATLALPFVAAQPWPDALGRLRRTGFTIVALTPAADARPLQGWRPGQGRVALLAGAEGSGLSDQALAAADVRLAIPLTDRVDSLNVHTAVAIALYHIRVSRES